MSKLSFELTRVDVPKKGNYFALIQLDETEFPSKLLRTTKFRTEIDYTTEFPNFLKNYFTFSNVQLGNRLIFRIGLFSFNNVSIITQEQKKTNKIPEKLLFDNSNMLGSADLVLDANWIDNLRKCEYVDGNKKLISSEIRNKEVAHIYFRIYCTSESLDAKIYEDNSEIEKQFFDPFEKDKKKISEKLKAVIVLNEEKQMDLEKMQKTFDETNRKLKYAVREKAKCERELQQCSEENDNLNKSIQKIQNYNEIHIEIDLLSQSPQGISIIEKKYAILLAQMQIQKNIKLEMEDEFNQIEPILSKINIIKTKYDTLQAANKELKFNHKRHEDMLPLLTTYQEKMKTNNNIINNLKTNIKDVVDLRKKNTNLTQDEIVNRINLCEKERKKLEEKKMQMNLFIEVYFKENGENKRNKTYWELTDPFYRIVGSDPTMNRILFESEAIVLENNKNRIYELNMEVKDLSDRLTEFEQKEKEKKEKGIVIQPSLVQKRNQLRDQEQIAQKRIEFLLQEIEKNKNEYSSAKQVLKDKINYYDELIEKELKYARMKKYEDDMNKETVTKFDEDYY